MFANRLPLLALAPEPFSHAGSLAASPPRPSHERVRSPPRSAAGAEAGWAFEALGRRFFISPAAIRAVNRALAPGAEPAPGTRLTIPAGALTPDMPEAKYLVGAPDPAWLMMAQTRQLAWGAVVSTAFKAKVLEMASYFGCDPNHLMAVMAFESGGTFRADQRNPGGRGAVGLIRFMPDVAAAQGWSTAALAAQTNVEQLDNVFVHLWRRLAEAKRRPTAAYREVEDVYAAVLAPAFLEKPLDAALYTRRDASPPATAPAADWRGDRTPYGMNRGLDADRDGTITKREAGAKVRAMLALGWAKHAG